MERLDDRLSLLGTGRRRGRDRHRTLRETIDWSFDLLSARERDVYARLAVFVDWFDLSDAAAVCGLGEIDTLDAVQALVAKSLLVRSEQRGHARFRYLESIRDHAWDQLARTGGVDHAMALMVDRVIDRLAWLVEQMWESDEPPVADITGLLPAHRHAARWCIDQRDLERGARLFTPFAGGARGRLPRGSPSGARAGRAHPHVASSGGWSWRSWPCWPGCTRASFREYRPIARDDPRDRRQLGRDPEGRLAGHPVRRRHCR